MKVKRNSSFFLVIILLVSVSYINIFQNTFVWDDNAFLLDLPQTKSKTDFRTTFQSILHGDTPPGHEGVYRPVLTALWYLAHAAFFAKPLGYHFLAILTHILASILVYKISSKIISKKGSLIAAAVFATHPIQTESITFMTAAFDTFGIVLMLYSFFLYLQSQKVFDTKYKLSLTIGLIAIFTNEIALILLPIIIFYEFTINQVPILKSLKKNLGFLIPYTIYLTFRLTFGTIATRWGYFADSFFLTMLLSIKTIPKYIQLLLFPTNLSIIHTIPNGIYTLGYQDTLAKAIGMQSILETYALFSILLLTGLIYGVFSQRKKRPIVSFSCGFFLLGLAPTLNFIPRAAPMAERYLYLPSVGFCILVGFVLSKFISPTPIHSKKRKPKRAQLLTLGIVILILLLTAGTLQRNADWSSPQRFWKATTQSAPQSDFAWYSYGLALQQVSDPSTISAFEKAIELNPKHLEAHLSLSAAQIRQGQFQNAIDTLDKAISIHQDPRAHFNRGLALEALNRNNEALLEYSTAIRLNPDYQKAKERFLRLKQRSIGLTLQ